MTIPPPTAAPPAQAATEFRDDDFALLSFHEAMLCNNVCFRGDIVGAKQTIFREGDEGGWTWDWPENTGPGVKAYPEIILGRSPWQPVHAGTHLPCPLDKVHSILDFDLSSEATGSWCTSFDFWITSSAHLTSRDIVHNLTIWTRQHAIEPYYKGRQEAVEIDGRNYLATFQTPAEDPSKHWSTLCLVDTEPRDSGSLKLGPLADFLTAKALALPTHFLATAEMGTEVAFGKGRTDIRRFTLR